MKNNAALCKNTQQIILSKKKKNRAKCFVILTILKTTFKCKCSLKEARAGYKRLCAKERGHCYFCRATQTRYNFDKATDGVRKKKKTQSQKTQSHVT